MSSHMVNGFQFLPEFLDRKAALQVLKVIKNLSVSAPFYTPVMPRTGKAFSVKMTNAGTLGWVSDQEGGYRYQTVHPRTGQPWPQIPQEIISLWRKVHKEAPLPECCLINYYQDPKARMGLHVDADEEDFSAPILSLSLGDQALFRIGGQARKGPTRSLRLSSGDVVSLGGEARRIYHGIDKVYPGTSTLLKEAGFPDGGRINVTLRRVTAAAAINQL
jgi:DNA oxidative demethylase